MARQSQRPGRRVQLHRALAKLGWGSRGQAWAWIVAGEVHVDGRIVTDPLTWVDLDLQRITRNQQATPPNVGPLTLSLHKPRGIVTTRRDERNRRTIYDLLPPNLPWIFPAGRLDADSEGLLILTTDAALAVRLTEPAHHVPKTYHVTLAGQIPAVALEQLRNGIELSDGRTRPAKARLLHTGDKESVIEMILTEGRNRQIRRMATAVGQRVRRLLRVAIGSYHLGDLASGAIRALDAADCARLLH